MTTAPHATITDLGAVAREEKKLVDRTLLQADLLEGYSLLARWQAKHRSEFPDQTISCNIAICEDAAVERGLARYDATISCQREGDERCLVFVSGFENTIREAVESAITGANTVVAESREAWLSADAGKP